MKRTLVKSAPELWGLADDESRMESWTALLAGDAHEPGVTVTRREPSTALAWRSTAGQPPVRIALELAERGFGTSVVITASHQLAAADAGDALERLLDELGSPERQPFVR